MDVGRGKKENRGSNKSEEVVHTSATPHSGRTGGAFWRFIGEDTAKAAQKTDITGGQRRAYRTSRTT